MVRLTAILFLIFTSCGESKKPTNDNVGIEASKVQAELKMVTDTSKSDGPMYSMDELYQQIMNRQLQIYLLNNHPKWSVPNQNKWYPKLFNKYKTKTSLVNYLSGDFDCSGTADYALLLDKGDGHLAVVAFLSISDSFKTVELTEWPEEEGDKINWQLTLFKPGKYNTDDPDTEPKDRHVNFKCPAIGIGSFEELYEGGRDVYYWEGGELRSCFIDE